MTEADPIRSSIDLGHCPDCQYRGFLIGPLGGMSSNIECGNTKCRSRFNITSYAGHIIRAERIGYNGAWPSEPGGSMVLHEWSCGHIAGSMCAECFRELAAKANALAEENLELRGYEPPKEGE